MLILYFPRMILMWLVASLSAPTPMTNPDALALLDTNVLIYADQKKSRFHQVAKALRDRAQHGELLVCISPQVLAEFFSTVTRSDGRGLTQPITPQEAADEVRKYLESEHIHKIYPTPGTWPILLSLIEKHPVTGHDIHDVHLAATMLSNGVSKIYTYNVKDFVPIPDIEVLNPLPL